MIKLNNKGVTLVEIVISIVILGIAGIMLVNSFSTVSNLIYRGNIYKNANSAVASSIELQEPIESSDANIEVSVNTDELVMFSENAEAITLNCEVWKRSTSTSDFKKASSFLVKDVTGIFVEAKETKSTNLKYKEFLPTNSGQLISAN